VPVVGAAVGSASPRAVCSGRLGSNDLRNVEEDLKVDLTRANLIRWFEDTILTSPIRVESIEHISPPDSIRIFDYPGDFVPVMWIEGRSPEVRHQTRVIDKPALSLQLARAYVTDLLEDVHR
jgi:hypothetical protein